MQKPELTIEVGEELRSDIDSDSAKKTYPDLPIIKNDWSRHQEYVDLRIKYIKEKDNNTYNEIKEKYPNFRPPQLH